MNEDRIIAKVVDMDERLTRVEEKVDVLDVKIDSLAAGIDHLIKITERHEEERLMTNVRLDRHETRIEALEAQAAT